MLSRLVDRTARLVIFCLLLSAGADLGFCAHDHEPIAGPAPIHLEWGADPGRSHGHSNALDYGTCFCHGLAVTGPLHAVVSPLVAAAGRVREAGEWPLAAARASVDHPPPSAA